MSKIYTSYNGLLFILISALASTFSTCTAEEISSSVMSPVKVVDGDSLEIGANRIRLIGIDAPEYEQYCKNSHKEKYSCGKQAKEYLKNLIADNQITCKIHKKDQYDRNLCTCYSNDKDLGAAMVSSGNAVIYMDNLYQKEEQDAKRHKRGIWQGKFMHPRLFRKLKEKKNK